MRPTPVFRAALIAASIISAVGLARAQEEGVEPGSDTVVAQGKVRDIGTRVPQPEVAPASDEGSQAIKRMKVPAGLEIKLWAAEPMLANPVAFNFDEKGRIFVAETYRYRSSVFDIRDYMWMLEDELACRTIEDRTALIKNKFGAAGVKELSIEAEVVRVLEDTKHTGVADHSAIYATGFNTPLDGIASGVLARRGKVWFTNIPSLWQFTGHDKAETRTELSRGYGVRFNYTGHDLHGLAFGPDGKLYFSIGDRGAHAVAKDGTVADSPDEGCVFRCDPDGTHLEVFARGLRNPQSLAFSENGDLFTGDNDCDLGDEERLVHVVEDGDSGWRIGYQFAPLGNAGPWNSEKLWVPRFKGQAAYFLPPICNIEDGPSGITYYPGTGLNDSYKGAIFITHFKGAVAKSGIYTYNVKPAGATYDIADAKPFLTSSLPTDAKFGPDGRLYVSDWSDGWSKSKKGRIYAIYDPKHVNDAIVKETQELIGSDWTKKKTVELRALLAHPDWRVRQEAQFTLAEAGEASIPEFAKVATTVDAPALARLHAVWGLGQLAEKYPAALKPIRALAKDLDAEVRAQSIKLLGDHHVTDVADLLIAALRDDNNRVRFFAAQSIGKLKITLAAPALLTALKENNDLDDYLRHALVMGLVGGNNLAVLNNAVNDESKAVRLGVLLAFRRLGRPEAQKFLADSDPYIVREAALAINDAPIKAAYPALAAMLDKPLTGETIYTEPVILRALNAHFRLGTPADAAALAGYAMRADAPAKLRAEAIAELATWPQPLQRDRVVGVYRPLESKTRDASVVTKVLSPELPQLLDTATPAEVQAATVLAIEKLKIPSANETLFNVVSNANQSPETRISALNSLDLSKDARLQDAVKIASNSAAAKLRLAALTIAARLSPDAAAPVLANLVAKGTVDEQKTAFKALGTLKHPIADQLLTEQLTLLAAGKVKPAVELELVTAAAKRSDPEVKKLLAAHDAKIAADTEKDPLAPFRVSLQGGDRKRGENIFQTQAVMPCVRCHRVGTESGGEAGPNLAGVASRNTREYLLESIVKPNAKIAPGFDTVVVTLKSGGVAAGIVASETGDTLTLRNTDNKLVEVKKTDIAKREGAPSGMPEIFGAVLTKSELRDVVEYLSSLRQRPGNDKPLDESKPRALRNLAVK